MRHENDRPFPLHVLYFYETPHRRFQIPDDSREYAFIQDFCHGSGIGGKNESTRFWQVHYCGLMTLGMSLRVDTNDGPIKKNVESLHIIQFDEMKVSCIFIIVE
jgi:hypothetical protein